MTWYRLRRKVSGAHAEQEKNMELTWMQKAVGGVLRRNAGSFDEFLSRLDVQTISRSCSPSRSPAVRNDLTCKWRLIEIVSRMLMERKRDDEHRDRPEARQIGRAHV